MCYKNFSVCCHITLLESCFVDVSYGSPLGVIQKWTSTLESGKANGAWAKHVFWIFFSSFDWIAIPLHALQHSSFSLCLLYSSPPLQYTHPTTSLTLSLYAPHLIALVSSAFSAVLYIPYCNTLRFPLQPFFLLLSSPTDILVFLPQPLPMFSGLAAGLVQSCVGTDLLANCCLLPTRYGKTTTCHSAAGSTNGSEQGSVRLL